MGVDRSVWVSGPSSDSAGRSSTVEDVRSTDGLERGTYTWCSQMWHTWCSQMWHIWWGLRHTGRKHLG